MAVEDIGIPVAYIYFGIPLGLLAAIFVAVLLKSRRRRMSLKERGEVWDRFSSLVEAKARLEAKLSVLEEGYKGGRMPQREYAGKVQRYKKEIAEADDKLDELISSLAQSYLPAAEEREHAAEREKASYLFRLQEEKKGLQAKLLAMQRGMSDAKARALGLEAENEGLKKRLDSTEAAQKERLIDLEQKLDTARKERMLALQEAQKAVEEQQKLSEQLKGTELPAKKIAELEKQAAEYSRKKQEMERVLKEHAELAGRSESYRKKMEDYYHQTLMYGMLVSRYAETIETSEAKTAEDLRGMVVPGHAGVMEIARKIKDEFEAYNPQYDFMRAAEKAYYWVCNNIASVPPAGVSFWMNVEDMLSNRLADHEDKAILFCSILRALDGDASVLVAELSDRSHRPLVILTFRDKNVLCDPNQRHDFYQYYGVREDLVKNYRYDGRKINRPIYEFNDKNYKQY